MVVISRHKHRVGVKDEIRKDQITLRCRDNSTAILNQFITINVNGNPGLRPISTRPAGHDNLFARSSNLGSTPRNPFARPRRDNYSAGLPMQREPVYVSMPQPPLGYNNASIGLPMQRAQMQLGSRSDSSSGSWNPETSSSYRSRRRFSEEEEEAAKILLKINSMAVDGLSSSSGNQHGEARLDAWSRPRGKFRPGDIERPVVNIKGDPDRKFEFMEHIVKLWLDKMEPKVVQADFDGNNPPRGGKDYKRNNFLCRPAAIRGFMTVVYIYKNGTLMGVRAPFNSKRDIVEPSSKLWFIAFAKNIFKVELNDKTEMPEDIYLATGNELKEGDPYEAVEFPWGDRWKKITFFMYRDQKDKKKVTGASLYPPQPPTTVGHSAGNLHNLMNENLNI
ncbi:uncharacterized protein LOC117169290 isoform X2 [Belonocnema kinseyi]|uniref:uncharacterized protein LOC117169290 isoform X2 n=1 Tax=Belonocnema kinseyi TaxID=2817044 RepID=UPI00143D6B17|nr:uncharacterized protein LOC117169290 isoform X2 [Belonocnema kinseyi]